MRKIGFTLAEVLIALALLGLVAAFTIPKLLQTTGEQEKISKFREAMGMLSEVAYGSALRDDLNSQLDPYKREAASPNSTIYVHKLVDYFAVHLNTVQKCYNSQAEGCWPNITEPVTLTLLQPDAAGMVLPNGAYLLDFEDNPGNEYGDTIYADYNGLKGPNQLGDDIFGIALYWGPQGNRRGGSVTCAGGLGADAQPLNDALCQKVLK